MMEKKFTLIVTVFVASLVQLASNPMTENLSYLGISNHYSWLKKHTFCSMCKRVSTLTTSNKEQSNTLQEIPYIDMMASLSETVPLEHIINKFLHEPLSIHKPLRALDHAGIGILDFYKKIESIYKKNFQATTSSTKNKIPLIMHKIWLGSALPVDYKNKIKEWRKKHPLWRVMVWTHETIAHYFPHGLHNQKTFNNALHDNNYSQASDVLRYEIIERFGGIYTDVDFECLQSIEQLHKMYDFYGSLEPPHVTCAGCVNGIFAAKAGHPIIKSCIKTIERYEQRPLDLSYCKNKRQRALENTWIKTGPGAITQAIFNEIDKEKNVDIVFPYQYFLGSLSGENQEISFSFHSYNTAEHPELHWTNALICRHMLAPTQKYFLS